MAALMKRRRAPGEKTRETGIVNYYVIDNRRAYRVCTQYGRVLMVLLRFTKSEVAMSPDGRRFGEIVRNCAKSYGLTLTRKGTTFHLTSVQ